MSHQAQEGKLVRIKEQAKLVKVVNSRVRQQLVEHRKYTVQSECLLAWREEIKTLKAFKVKS